MKTHEEIINEIEKTIAAVIEDMGSAHIRMRGQYIIVINILYSLLEFIKEDEK